MLVKTLDFYVTFDEMYGAVTENHESYDTIFFCPGKSTEIYCRASCKSKEPKPENIEFFKTANQA